MKGDRINKYRGSELQNLLLKASVRNIGVRVQTNDGCKIIRQELGASLSTLICCSPYLRISLVPMQALFI